MSRTRFVCKCACGGNVRGVREFDRWFTWCTKCTPVAKLRLTKDGRVVSDDPRKPKKRNG